MEEAMEIRAPAEPETVAPPDPEEILPPEPASPLPAGAEFPPPEALPPALLLLRLGVFVFGFGLDLALPDWSSCKVLAPTVPSVPNPFTDWKATTASLVSSPK